MADKRGSRVGGLLSSSRFSLKGEGVEATSEAMAVETWVGAGWRRRRRRRRQEASSLVVSIVATLGSGDAYYIENKAVLEVRRQSRG